MIKHVLLTMSHTIGIKAYLDELARHHQSYDPKYSGFAGYKSQLISWWESAEGPTDSQISRTIRIIKQLLTCDEYNGLYGIKRGVFINATFGVDDPSYLSRENRTIVISESRPPYYCKIYMKVVDFYKLCYGKPITDFSYMDYRIIKFDYPNNSEQVIIYNNKVMLNIDEITLNRFTNDNMTKGIANKTEIQRSLVINEIIRLNKLKELAEFQCLPFELIELIADYSKMNITFNYWD